MLSDDPEITRLDARHLRNWWRLTWPPRITEELNYLLLITQQGTLLHALVSNQGAIPTESVDYTGTSRSELLRLRHSLRVDAVFVLEQEALTQLATTFDRSLSLGNDYLSQGIGLWQALRSGDGIWSSPPLLDLIPPLRADALAKTFQFLVPDNSTLLAYVIDEQEGQIHCSAIAEKVAGKITLATMHPAISDLVSDRELCRNWRENYSKINRAVESRLSRPSVGIFISQDAFTAILKGPPDQLSKEISAGNLIIDPAPAWLKGILGGAAVAAAAGASAKRMARFLPKRARQMAGGMASVAQDRMKQSSINPFSKLGFDPIALLNQLRGFYS